MYRDEQSLRFFMEGRHTITYEAGQKAEEHFQAQHLEERLSFEARDFFHDPLPAGHDAYSLGFILHDWDEEAGSHLLEKISEAIRADGLLIIGESLLDADRAGPLHVAAMI